MSNIIGRGIKIEIAATYGSAKTVSAVTQDSPGEATSTSHGLSNGTVGYFSGVSGMVQLEGQAGRVYNQATNTFDIQGLNTTSYSAFTGTCSFTPVSTWATLSEATAYSQGGGEASKVNVTRLIDDITQEANGLLAAQTYSIPILAQDVPSAAMTLLEDAAIAQDFVVVRVTFNATGAVRVFRGQPSLPGEDVQQGAAGTGAIAMSVKGIVCKGAA